MTIHHIFKSEWLLINFKVTETLYSYRKVVSANIKLGI